MAIKKETTKKKPQKIKRRRRTYAKRKAVSGKRQTSSRNTVNNAEARREQIAKVHKKRRKKRKRNYTLYYIILALFLVIAGIVLSMTVFFNIESIEVEGSEVYTFEDVYPLLDVEPGDNLLRLNARGIGEELLSEFKKADNVEVKRVFPTTLLIRIKDGVPTTQLYSDDRYYILSEKTRVLDISEQSIANVPIIVGPDAKRAPLGSYVTLVLENEEKDWISILFNEIEKSEINDISAIDIRNTISIKIYYQNRFQINLGSFSELDTKLAMLKGVIESGNVGIEESGVIDVTDPDRLYVDSDAELELSGLFAEGWDWTDPHVEVEIPPAEEKVSEEISEEIPPEEESVAEESPET